MPAAVLDTYKPQIVFGAVAVLEFQQVDDEEKGGDKHERDLTLGTSVELLLGDSIMTGMVDISGCSLWAIVPIVPTLYALAALIPIALFSLLAALASLRNPRTALKLLRFLWSQKRSLLVLAGALGLTTWAVSMFSQAPPPAIPGEDSVWAIHRGGLDRRGWVPTSPEPTRGGIMWQAGRRGEAFYSSPAVVGDRIYVVGSIGDRGAIYCLQDTGQPLWTCRPPRYRATFSSPVVMRDFLLCGEGLHYTRQGRVVCVDLRSGREGQLLWTHATDSHVECTPFVDGQRAYVGAGDDGVYCLDLDPELASERRVVWHAPGTRYPDAETCLAVHNGRVYVGLGVGGRALCVLEAGSGRELKRIPLRYPAFGPPAIHQGHLYFGTGEGNVIEGGQRAGQVYCLDLDTLEIDWEFATPGTVLGAIAAADGQLVFGCADGRLYVLDADGRLLRSYDTHAPIRGSPAVTAQRVYVLNQAGLLYALDTRTLEVDWEHRIGRKGRYLSSPVVAHGSVYVGTENDQFIRIGRPATSDSSDWPGSLGGPGVAGCLDDSRLPPTGHIAWSFPGEPEAGRLVSAPVAVANERLVVPLDAASRRGVVCLRLNDDADPPRACWEYASPHGVSTSPVIVAERVLFIDGHAGQAQRKLRCLSLGTGELLWQAAVADQGSSPLIADRQGVLVVEEAGELSCRGLDGRPVWRRPLAAVADCGFAGPSIALVTTERPAMLTAVDRPTGSVLWRVPLQGLPTTAPVAVKNRVFVGTAVGLEIRSLVDGSLLHKTPRGLGGVSGPQRVRDGQFAYVSSTGMLIAGSGLTGQVLTTLSGVRPATQPLVGRRSLLFIADDGLKTVSRQFDTERPSRWCEQIRGEQITSLPVLHRGCVYLGTRDRGLVCLRGSELGG